MLLCPQLFGLIGVEYGAAAVSRLRYVAGVLCTLPRHDRVPLFPRSYSIPGDPVVLVLYMYDHLACVILYHPCYLRTRAGARTSARTQATGALWLSRCLLCCCTKTLVPRGRVAPSPEPVGSPVEPVEHKDLLPAQVQVYTCTRQLYNTDRAGIHTQLVSATWLADGLYACSGCCCR